MGVTHAKTNNIANITQTILNAAIAAGQYPAGTTLGDIVLAQDWNDDHIVEIASSDMVPTGVTAGVYESANVTVDVAGRITQITGGATSLGYYNVRNYGALGDGVQRFDCLITAGHNVATCTGRNFTAADIGKCIGIIGAGPVDISYSPLVGTITGISGTNAVLSVTATTTVSNANVVFGTDDTLAFDAAMNAANAGGFGGIIEMPNGIFIITAPIQWQTKVSMIGNGFTSSYITWLSTHAMSQTGYEAAIAGVSTAFGGSTAANPYEACIFRDFAIDMSFAFVGTLDYRAKCFDMLHCLRCLWMNLYLHDSPATALGVDFLRDSVIFGCHIVNAGRLSAGGNHGCSGISWEIGEGAGNVEYTFVCGNTVVNAASYCIAPEETDPLNTNTQRMVIANNICRITNSYGNGIQDNGIKGAIIVGNVCTNTNVSNTAVGISAGGGTNPYDTGNTGLIANNYVEGFQFGIAVESISGISPNYYSVKDNVVVSSTKYGISVLNLEGTSDTIVGLVIDGNLVTGSFGPGIAILANGGSPNFNQLRITNNTCANNGVTTVTDVHKSGIYINGNIAGLMMTENYCYDNGSNTQKYGIVFDTGRTITSAQVTGNHLNNNTSVPFLFNSVPTGVITGNYGQNTAQTMPLYNSNTAALSAMPGAAGGIQVGTPAGTNTSILLDCFGASPILYGRSTLGTNASRTLTTAGSLLLSLVGIGYDGSAYTNSAAAIQFNAVTDFSGSSTQTNITFGTTPSGSTTRATVATITSAGNFTITGQYQINGTQIAASNLSNGTTGSGGGVVLATGATLSSPAFTTPALGTPASGVLTNCTFPTLNQNTSGSAASLSISGQTGLLTFVGLTSTNRAKTVRDAADTILELGGSYTPTGTWTSLTMVTPVLGTPTSGTLTNCTFPTLNQNTTGSAGSVTGSTATVTSSYGGAASTAVFSTTGTIFTGGTGTTNFPQIMQQPSGATAFTGWSPSGTFHGINAASGFTGNYCHYSLNNSSVYRIDSGGGIHSVSSLSLNGPITGVSTISQSGKTTTYNNVSTVGWGVPAIYGTGRSTAQTAAVASVAAYTVGAADGSFLVSANANITTFVAGTFNITVAYTDETNTAQSLKLSFSTVTGTVGIALAASGPFEGVPVHIRCKASTAITIASSGTFTSLTYNVEGYITQIG